MDAETVRVILEEVFKRWGLVALFLLLMSVMAGVSVVQIRQMRRWQPETKEIANLLRENITVLKDIVGKLDTQHAVCTRHYDFAQKQIEGMAGIGNELASVVSTIRDSDRARTAEIMQLMVVIAGRSPQ